MSDLCNYPIPTDVDSLYERVHTFVPGRIYRRVEGSGTTGTIVEDAAAEGLSQMTTYWWPKYGCSYGPATAVLACKFAVDRGTRWVKDQLIHAEKEAMAMEQAANRAGAKDRLAQMVDLFIETVPDRERAVFEGIYWECLSERDIAARLGISRHRVRLIHEQGVARMGTGMMAWRAGYQDLVFG